MKSAGYGKRAVSLLLIMVMIATPFINLGAQEKKDAEGDFMLGKIQGEADAKGSPLWFLAGLGCGIIGVGVAYLVKPGVPASELIGQSSDYTLGYSEGYKNKGRLKNTEYACVGWGVWMIVYFAAIMPNAND
jgi:hypothetical protein